MTNFTLIIISVSIVAVVYSLFNYNPMYSLLFFILFLFNFVTNLFIQNYEFIALLIGLIYFGAILILFFFILLLINLQVVTRDTMHIKRVTLVLIPLSFLNFWLFIYLKQLGLYVCQNSFVSSTLLTMESISFILFTNFGVYVIIVSLLLFLVLIGLVLILINNKSIKLKFGKVSK